MNTDATFQPFTFNLSKDMYELLRTIAYEGHTTIAGIIRAALEETPNVAVFEAMAKALLKR